MKELSQIVGCGLMPFKTVSRGQGLCLFMLLFVCVAGGPGIWRPRSGSVAMVGGLTAAGAGLDAPGDSVNVSICLRTPGSWEGASPGHSVPRYVSASLSPSRAWCADLSEAGAQGPWLT